MKIIKTKDYVEMLANEGQFYALFSEMAWTDGWDAGLAEREVRRIAEVEGVELEDDGTEISDELYELYIIDNDKGLS